MADFGSVLNRTTVAYIEYAELSEDKYPTDAWIYNPDLSAVEGVMPRYWKVNADDVFEMTQAEKEAVDAADLTTFKARGKARIDTVMREYIDGKYPPTTLAILNSLYAHALDSGLTNRAAYLDDLHDWFVSLVNQQTTHNTTIDGSTTLEAIEAVVWDFSSFDASDPAVTPVGALAITD